MLSVGAVALVGQPLISGLDSVAGQSLNRAEIESNNIVTAGKTHRKGVTVFTGDDVIPQFVEGAGWSTAITFVNLDTTTIKFSLYFIADDGSDMSVPILGVGTNVRH
jgi:hypothetical protein